MAAKAKVSQIGAALYWLRRKQRYWRLRAVDPWHNRRCRPERFLVLRHHFKPHFYQHFLDWVARNFPEERRLFELNLVPCRVTRWDEYRLHLPWLQDPVQHWSPEVYTHALRLQEKCDERGIPVINRVDRLTNATKSKAAAVLNGAGLRTARMARVTDFAAFRDNFLGLRLPLFVREDWGHGGQIRRADTPDEARSIPLESFSRPLAVEFVDSRSADGHFRKYRYIAAGDVGVSHHLQMSNGWETRGHERIKNAAAREEELAYIAKPDRHHCDFQRARRQLGFDFVAFDYAYEPDGRMIVWEVNPFPRILFSRSKLKYRDHAIERTVAAMLALYLDRAGLPRPEKLTEKLTYS